MHYLKAFAIATLAVLLPIRPLFLAAMGLVALDTISGILAARKRGERISSAGLRRSIAKSLVYSLAILAGYIGEKYLMGDLIPVSKLVGGAIGVAELLSVLENLNTVLGVNIFAALIAKLGSKNDPANAATPPPAPPSGPST